MKNFFAKDLKLGQSINTSFMIKKYLQGKKIT